MTEITTKLNTASLEALLVQGDLSKLNTTEKLEYYLNVCESLGLNPTTTPFCYIRLNNKLTLYATKACTDQLRRVYSVSVTSCVATLVEGIYCVVATGSDKTGRTDTELGAVAMGKLQGEAKANAMMKAQTKAKRRLTLSLCGLGMLDETEVETIPNAVTMKPEVAHAVIEHTVEESHDWGDQTPTGKPESSDDWDWDNPTPEEGGFELHNTESYVESVEMPTGTNKPFRITFNNPVGDQDGTTGERKRETVTTFDKGKAEYALSCSNRKTPVAYTTELNGNFVNLGLIRDRGAAGEEGDRLGDKEFMEKL